MKKIFKNILLLISGKSKNYFEYRTHSKAIGVFAILILLLQSCTPQRQESEINSDSTSLQTAGDTVPQPYATKSAKNFSKVIGWPENKTPQAPSGFKVTKFAEGLQNPRWIYVTPNGDILVAESNTESKA